MVVHYMGSITLSACSNEAAEFRLRALHIELWQLSEVLVPPKIHLASFQLTFLHGLFCSVDQ